MSILEMKERGGGVAHGRLAKAISRPPLFDTSFCTKESSRGAFARAFGRSARAIAANAEILMVRWWSVNVLKGIIVGYLSFCLLACLLELFD